MFPEVSLLRGRRPGIWNEMRYWPLTRSAKTTVLER